MPTRFVYPTVRGWHPGSAQARARRELPTAYQLRACYPCLPSTHIDLRISTPSSGTYFVLSFSQSSTKAVDHPSCQLECDQALKSRPSRPPVCSFSCVEHIRRKLWGLLRTIVACFQLRCAPPDTCSSISCCRTHPHEQRSQKTSLTGRPGYYRAYKRPRASTKSPPPVSRTAVYQLSHLLGGREG